MKFSIITVCRNAAPAIVETLESALNQTGVEREQIVIDGASTDGTVELIENYRNRLAAFISEPDRSIYEAMNKGIDRATGDYLFFLNAGDILAEPDLLARVQKALQEKPDLLIGDVWLENPDGSQGRLKRHHQLDKPHFYRDSVTQQAVFYRHDLFNSCGKFDETLKIVGDHEWLLRGLFLHRLRVRYWPHVICKFRLGGISTNPSQNAKVAHANERLEVTRKYFSPWELRLLESPKFKRLMGVPAMRPLAWFWLKWNIA